MQTYKMWIGGKRVDAVSGKTFKAINPATEEEIAQIPLGGQADVDKAVDAARKAFPIWSKKPQAERSRIVNQIAIQIMERAQEFAKLDVIDHGAPIGLANGFVRLACSRLEYAARASQSIIGEVLPSEGRPNTLFYWQREPIGVCALITPWNVPLGQVAGKLGGCLSVGNTCVIKPPAVDSMAALQLVDILEKLDLPPGTINVVSGPGGTVGEALTTHPGVEMVAFTGSTETGKAIMAAASQRIKRLALELGGKNAFIVLEDADLDAAVNAGVLTITMNTGQICAAPGRFYVHEKVHDDFVDRFVAKAKKVVVGDPNDPNTQMGPVVSKEHRDKVENYIKIGVEEGAKLVLGSQKRSIAPPLDKGYYVMPAVFTNVTQNMRIARDEIFGPVACIMKFSNEDEVIGLANDSAFGLCASVWTASGSKGIRLAREISAGTVSINDHGINSPDLPWGGFRESGLGKEHSMLGLKEYTQIKLITLNLAEKK